MPLIATLTMNPAIDISTTTERVEPERKLRCEPGRRDPGGGGINVARAARRLGAETVAVYPIGGFVGRLLEALVRGEHVRSVAIPVGGETREDFTVRDDKADTQFRFVLPGPSLTGVEWRACLDAFVGLDPKPDYYCASGSLPPGAPDDLYAQCASALTGAGARFALDTSGPALKLALGAGVHLIKPNLREMRELTGLPLDDDAGRVAACRALIGRGAVEVVVLTLGAAGSMLVTRDEAWRAPPLAIHAVSTVGAGDSFVGSLIWALASGLSLHDAFGYGVAGGSATVLATGTALFRPEDVTRLLREVRVEPIKA